MGEVGQHVGSAAVQGASEGGKLLQSGGEPGAEGVDQSGQAIPAVAGVGVGVGGDDLLVDVPGHLDREMGVVGEHRLKSSPLPGGEQLQAGA